jgi:hypothetical protein
VTWAGVLVCGVVGFGVWWGWGFGVGLGRRLGLNAVFGVLKFEKKSALANQESGILGRGGPGV